MNKKRYIIMGSTPGDGGVVVGYSPTQALGIFLSQSHDIAIKEVLIDMKKNNMKVIKITKGRYSFGDYEINKINDEVKK